MFPRWKLDYLWFNFHFVQKLKSIETDCRGETNHKEKTKLVKNPSSALVAALTARRRMSENIISVGGPHVWAVQALPGPFG